MSTRRAVLVLLSAVLGPPACATGNLVDVRIVDRSAHELLPTYRHRGSDWVAGQPGNRYAVQMTNRSDGRVLVVLSVDGVNAISGETAAFGQTGYVLAPHSSAEITGWRKSYREAAAFYFTSLADSYAARTDRPENVGVIGAAVYRERARWPEPRSSFEAAPPVAKRDESSPREPAQAADNAAPQADSAAPRGEAEARSAAPAAAATGRLRERLGTGHGEREYSPTSQVAFERASREPAEVVKLRYDSYASLVELGVIGGWREPYAVQPFPRFAADPRSNR
ncbi:MAG: hypothetical protein ABI156_15535 [Caldimonas sp.]